MRARLAAPLFAALLLAAPHPSTRAAHAAPPREVVDVPTRPGVTQRFLYLPAEAPRAAVVLFAGGNGGLQIGGDGTLGWGKGNFLVRSAGRFVDAGLAAVVVDAPSDRQGFPYLGGFRQTPEHVEDVRGVVAWLRKRNPRLPVWLVGTSRGTQSATHVAVALAGTPDSPDGVVLTSTILEDPKTRAVPEMDLSRLALPVLVVHHRKDGCNLCPPDKAAGLLGKLSSSPRKELFLVDGGADKGNPCESFSHHGFNGNEGEVVGRIAAFVTAGK